MFLVVLTVTEKYFSNLLVTRNIHAEVTWPFVAAIIENTSLSKTNDTKWSLRPPVISRI